MPAPLRPTAFSTPVRSPRPFSPAGRKFTPLPKPAARPPRNGPRRGVAPPGHHNRPDRARARSARAKPPSPPSKTRDSAAAKSPPSNGSSPPSQRGPQPA
jgi:hypothetical protein